METCAICLSELGADAPSTSFAAPSLRERFPRASVTLRPIPVSPSLATSAWRSCYQRQS
eukprot:COSAG04_NODE_20214_length_398_cov_0.755853_1_plen_58_part_10